MSELIDLTGKKFGKLTVIEQAGRDSKGKIVWKCKCDCGNYCTVSGVKLRRRSKKSCGCKWMEPGNKTHGMTGTPLFTRWINMKSRCNNPHNKSYPRYGGRGIKVCAEWENDFMAFYEWATSNGYEESLTLDRINNNRGYCPDNCRWVGEKQQANNRSTNKLYTINGEAKTLAEWCEQYNMPYYLVISRLRKNISIENALSKDYKRRNAKHNEYFQDLEKKANICGIDYKVVRKRIREYGWSEEKALTTPVHHSRSYRPKPLSRPDKNSVLPSPSEPHSKDKP